jgi:tetratricopeptide (TPR) repeat protein
MEQLYKKFKSKPITADYCVSFYNESLITINNIQKFDSEHDLLLFAEIYYGCMFSLIQRNQYNKAIDSIVRVLPILEEGIDKFNINKSKFHHYVWLLWQQGIAYYYLKEYGQSIKLFKKVYTYEPDNEKIQEWLERAKLDRVTRYTPFLLIIALFGMISTTLWKASITRSNRTIILIVTFLILLLVSTLEIYVKRNRRKIKSN